MRLIDADAMLKRNEFSIYDVTGFLKEMLDKEPTVNIEEVLIDEYCKECFGSLGSIDESRFEDSSSFIMVSKREE